MKGFKDSTKTQYSMGGYAKGGAKGAAKISKVMGEFKSGALHSGSKKGPEVSNPKQAVAIALSEARKAGANIPMKKADGGAVSSFGRALREARAEAARAGNADAGIFTWNGKKYTTKLKSDTAPDLTKIAPPAPPKRDLADDTRSGMRKDAEKPLPAAKLAPEPATLKDAFSVAGAAQSKIDADRDAARAAKVQAMEAAAARRNREAPATLKGAFARAGAAQSKIDADRDAASAQRAAAISGAYAKGGPVKRTKAVPVAPKGPMFGAKKQMGGMASSIRTNPDLNQQDRRFVEDRAAQMRGVAGKPMKKGGYNC